MEPESVSSSPPERRLHAGPSAAAEAAAFQAYLVVLGASLRQAAADVLAHRRRIEPLLPPEPVRHAVRQEQVGGLSLSLYDLAEGLVAEGLSPVIADLQRMIGASEADPCPPEIDFFEIWRELDPGAPAGEAA